jgi:hypothetical protein
MFVAEQHPGHAKQVKRHHHARLQFLYGRQGAGSEEGSRIRFRSIEKWKQGR